MNKLKKLNWQDCLQFSFKQSLHPDMLTDNGYQVTKFLRFSRQDKPILVTITVDRDLYNTLLQGFPLYSFALLNYQNSFKIKIGHKLKK